ncbi:MULTISPECIES: BREX system Lon protease-like protein BrxL [Deefgea]|uniref:BREX system Lon protease-like protein BrxL n=1 Tax=Deefgea chitinilytica TaxID=570276 RepID=A0ABS2C943_9NEIS|nr:MULTISPECIES: BREX system Lon protease-like protein BrxL [Deefgea]MBM5570547.1 BREX system Lon protease-like protein BrxL [Deefgea chitinilytica]MBM9887776.1 BREX system Lon protease-like protein BrxL [Deefgea sp. CFH1-16]
MELDLLDRQLAEHFPGYIVRKDLVRTFSRQFPVPTYVVEFLLGRYCATTDEAEIQEGLGIVQRQLESRTVKAGEEELFKARAKEQGQVKIIDIITARLDAKTDSYVASLPSLRLNDVRIAPEMLKEHERMLTGGFYAEVTLGYDSGIAQEKGGRAFGIDALRAIQLSKREVLDVLGDARSHFTTEEWKNLLLRSIGIEPDGLNDRSKDAMLLRMVPFVERNYNLVELGPRGTGKSHLFQQISPYAHLISGGKATVARMFVNNANGQRGLVCQYDVVCFDEVSGVSFDQKDGVNIMKGYMESGEFSRGKESIRADGSIVLVGNFDVDVEHQQRIGHLFGPMPPEMRDDTAFMDRIHCFLPGWDVPKMGPTLFTSHFGLVSDFLSECFTQLRNQSRVSMLQGKVHWGGALSGRDITAVQKTVSGLLKLLYPKLGVEVLEADLEWAIRLALEVRRRVKEQQKRIGAAEFRNTHFSYTLGEEGVEKFVTTPELQSDNSIGNDPLEPGQVWAIGPGGQDDNPGLYRIEATEGPGSGVKILNNPKPAAFQESVRFAEQNLYTRAMQLVGDRDPRSHEFSLQLRSFDAAKSGAKLGMGTLISLCGALLKKSVRGGLIVVGELNLGGSIEPIHNPVTLAEIAVEKGAVALLMPVSCRRQLYELSDDMATKVDIQFYQDARDALLKAIGD